METHVITEMSELIDELRRERNALLKALQPFAAMHRTGYVGSAYENGPPDKAVLVHHASGTVLTLGDFAAAHDAVTGASNAG